MENNKEFYKVFHTGSAEELVRHIKQFCSSRNYNNDIVNLSREQGTLSNIEAP